MLKDNAANRVDLPAIEAMVTGERQGIEPELARCPIAPNVNVHRLVAVQAEEKQPVWARNPRYRRHSPARRGVTAEHELRERHECVRTESALSTILSPHHFSAPRIDPLRDAGPPRQVIVTSHSPYLLDFFRDDPGKVVIAQRHEAGAHFTRLAAVADLDELLGDTGLGEAWYSGVLGGVPVVG